MVDDDENSLPRPTIEPHLAPSLWNSPEPLIEGDGVWIFAGQRRAEFWPPHRHDHVQLLIGSKGCNATATSRDRDDFWRGKPLKADEVWLLPPGVEQKLRWREPAGMIGFLARQSVVRELCGFEIAEPTIRPLQQCIDRMPPIGLLCDDLRRHSQAHDQGTQRHIAAIGTACFSYLLRAHFSTNVAQLLPPAERAWQDVRARVDRYMLTHLSDPFSMAEIAKAARMSRWYFCRMFKEKTTVTPRYYFNRLRIVRARDLLANQGCTITQAMHTLGFHHYGHFRTAFRRHLKVEPAYFKQLYVNAIAGHGAATGGSAVTPLL